MAFLSLTIARNLLCIVGSLMLAVGSSPSTARAETLLKISGTGSALGTMRQLATAYEKTHPGVTIKIMPSLGSTGGIKAVLGGGIDLGLASRPLKEGELQQGARSIEYAKTPFVFITHPGVVKKNLSTQELENIYGRPDARWPNGKNIRLILRPEQDTDTILIASLSSNMQTAVNAAHSRPGMTMAITDQEAADAVLHTPAAFGTATLSEIISERLNVNILSFNGILPSVKALSDKSYPLSKSLFLVTSPKTPPEAHRFLEFVTSPAAAKILLTNGSLPVKVR